MFGRPLVAIDIGSSAIKVVEMLGQRQRKLGAIGLEVLPSGAVVDGMIQNQEAVETVLRELLRKLKIGSRGRRVALALGGSSVVVKKVAVALKDGNELGEQVNYEAEQHFQADISEIYFDWTELANAPAPEGERPVLLAGARREMVEQYLAAVRAVGMRTGVIECDAFSIANMFEYNYGVVEGLTALVNIGASATKVSLLTRGEYVYARDLPIAGEEYSRQIMDAMGVDRDNAETLKVGVSQGDQRVPLELHKVLGTVNEQLVAEIQTTIDFYAQSSDPSARESGLTSVFLTGGGSRILGLDAALAAALQVPVQIVNPFQRVEVNPKKFQMDYILMQGHLYGVAVGLGLRALGDKE
jgi:type IV pilus assembly protein PilM